MGRPPLEDKPSQKILSWRAPVALVDLFDLIHKEHQKQEGKARFTKLDSLEVALRNEAKRLKIKVKP